MLYEANLAAYRFGRRNLRRIVTYFYDHLGKINMLVLLLTFWDVFHHNECGPRQMM